jgi:hypothetical protein
LHPEWEHGVIRSDTSLWVVLHLYPLLPLPNDSDDSARVL